MTEKVLLSKCLAGFPCRWDGQPARAVPLENLRKLLAGSEPVPFCPECGGGLPTPREQAEIEPGKTAAGVLTGSGRVLTRTGRDVTAQYVRGAEAALDLCMKEKITRAILKSKSPSCGCRSVYSGRFDGKLTAGRGITAELLRSNGIDVCDETGNMGDN